MDFRLVAVFLLTSCSSVFAPPLNPVLSTVNSFNPLSPENVVNFYSISNAIDIHLGCYKWCWCRLSAENREKCSETKRAKCDQLDKFSYKSFIAYQLARMGMGKLASYLPVPQAVIDAGMMVAANGVAAVLNGVGTAAEGVASGVKVAVDGVAAGGKLAADGVRTGTALAADGVSKGMSVATGAAGAAAGGVGAMGSAAASGVGAAGSAAASGVGAAGSAATKGLSKAVSGSFNAASSMAGGLGFRSKQ